MVWRRWRRLASVRACARLHKCRAVRIPLVARRWLLKRRVNVLEVRLPTRLDRGTRRARVAALGAARAVGIAPKLIELVTYAARIRMAPR